MLAGISVASAPNNPRKAKATTPTYAETKRQIVEGAIELMAKRGLDKFRFETLAAHIGCSRATIYRYFDSKRELMTEVMTSLMDEITIDVVERTAVARKVTRARFAQALHGIITDLRHNRRYAMVRDARNVEIFAHLLHQRFSAITSTMLTRFLTDSPSGRVLKSGIEIPEAVHWLQHQIISYGFFGLPGKTDKQQKDYLSKMVASVILDA